MTSRRVCIRSCYHLLMIKFSLKVWHLKILENGKVEMNLEIVESTLGARLPLVWMVEWGNQFPGKLWRHSGCGSVCRQCLWVNERHLRLRGWKNSWSRNQIKSCSCWGKWMEIRQGSGYHGKACWVRRANHSHSKSWPWRHIHKL